MDKYFVIWKYGFKYRVSGSFDLRNDAEWFKTAINPDYYPIVVSGTTTLQDICRIFEEHTNGS